MRDISIVIVGVGGQGTLLASRILGALAGRLGMDVKVSEVHGMAQRGGSVETFVRMGKKVHSPLVERGGADYVVAFEQLEAARALSYLRKGGLVIANTQRIAPMPVVTGAVPYPEALIEKIGEKAEVLHTDALAIAEGAGSARAVNIALLGMLARHMGIDRAFWEDAIKDSVPPKTLEINLRAFEGGYQAASV